MKKRTIISIIISIIIIIATNKYWLIFKPIPVSMDIKGGGTSNIEALLNKKDDDKFNKIKSEKVEINLDESNHVDLYVKRSKFPKRAKFIISNLQTKNDIYLSNIKVGKYEIKNMDKFEINGATVSVKDDKLILKPDFDSITLTYPETLHVRTSIKYDFKIFVIILILTYFLAYKLTDYVADYKSVEGKSRIEIIFLTIFFVFLFIPMTHINQAEISKQENRTLAKWQPLIKENNEINFEFGKNFNEWFNDRFALRNICIEINRYLRFYLKNNVYSESVRYFNKKNHWAFNSDWIETKNITPLEFSNYEKNLKKLNIFCNKNNIKLYILIVPSTGEVYDKEFQETTFIKQIENPGEKFSNYTKSKNINYVISPLKELKNVKDKYPYTKGDVHWNEYGGYIAYKKLMSVIKSDFPNLKILNDNDFIITKDIYSKTDYNNYPTNGNLYRELNIPNTYLDTKYYHFEYKNSADIYRYMFDKPDENTFNKNSLNTQSVYIIGNSYEECLVDFFIASFKQVYKRRYNTKGNGKLQFSRFEKDIMNKKPDILIIETLSHTIEHFNDLFVEE